MQKITRKYLDSFLKRHASQERALDIGAGGSPYHRYFPNRYTIDIDPARKPDLVADAQALPFADGEFRLVLCTEVLEHVRDPRAAIAEMRRVLGPGGTLILTTRFVYPIHDAPGDYWRFTRYGMEALFEEWDIVELVPETVDFETLAVLAQRLGYQTRMRLNVVAKAFTYACAALLPFGNRIITKRYGDITKRQAEDYIMASGYFLVAKKR